MGDGADPSLVRADSDGLGRDQHDPLKRRRSCGRVFDGVGLLPAPGLFDFQDDIVGGGPDGKRRRKIDRAEELKPRHRSMQQRMHAVGHEARKCQHQWRRAAKCEQDLGANAEQWPLAGDAA